MENEGKSTKVNRIMASMRYEINNEVAKEQERTRVNKELFLQYFGKNRGIISFTCAQVGIDRGTFYNWKNDDKEFREALEKVNANRNDDVEDVLMEKIHREKDGHCTTFYLKSRHPNYKTKIIQEVIKGERTLEDLIAEDNQREDEKEYEKNKSGTDRGIIQDPGQAGNDSQIQSECGATVLLGKEDAPKPDTQSQTKRAV
jgi:hypothetical protein